METTKAEGAVREAAGTVQETIGALTGDTGAQLAGKAEELRGKAQQLYGDATSLARRKVTSNPLGALASATVLGFVIGALWSFNRGSPDDSATRRR